MVVSALEFDAVLLAVAKFHALAFLATSWDRFWAARAAALLVDTLYICPISNNYIGSGSAPASYNIVTVSTAVTLTIGDTTNTNDA